MASKPYATTGDVNPFDYGGGIIYKDGNDYTLVVWPHLGEDIDEDNKSSDTPVYIIPIPEDVLGWNDWVKVKELSSTIGMTSSEIREASSSPDPVIRASLLDDIGSYYGYENLDSYPERYTLKELKAMYKKSHAAAKRAEDKRRVVR